MGRWQRERREELGSVWERSQTWSFLHALESQFQDVNPKAASAHPDGWILPPMRMPGLVLSQQAALQLLLLQKPGK